ncbi:VWA domain-containing protein [Peribacillus simplex]|uniref:vWA domain-containing protein n=1 Tax=Peribacillus simplex TaxID=1478 RepID=UPI000F632D93|nr:BatA and WFA domain-containing protein [Peribacillus simplex]RRN70671.1 VWA domain-containing protein [Peribacillus simplex]
MHISNPLFFLLIIFIAAVILFYFFRKQYETTTISSNLLWEQVLNEWQASPWLHKLQYNLLFWLQILVLLLLMFSLVRPFWFQKGIPGDHLILIVDTSATMSAKDGEHTLFEKVKQEVMEMLKEVDNQEVTIIEAGQKPIIRANHETNHAVLKKQTAALELTYDHENIDKALKLADSLSNGKETVIHLFSDRVVKDDLSGLSEDIPIDVHNFSSQNDNLSLLSFGTASRKGGITGVAVVENQTNKDKTFEFQVTNGKESLFTKKLSVKANSKKTVDIPVLKEKPYYTALINVNDNYSADNKMTAIQTAIYEKVYAVGTVNAFFINGLETIGLDVIQLEDKEKVGKDGVVIAEGMELEELGSYPLLFVNEGRTGKQKLTEKLLGTDDPLMEYVQTEKIYIESKSTPINKQWTNVLISGDSPLIQKGTYQGQPIIALNFSVADSDWPLQPGFPIFLYNSFQWLTQHSNFLGYYQPGEEKWLNLGKDTQKLAIFSESGNNLYSVDLQKEGFKAPSKPGTYEAVSGDQVFYFSVLLDEREKGIVSAPSFNINTKSTNMKEVSDKQDYLWYWLACTALLLLMFEWEVYRRGR